MINRDMRFYDYFTFGDSGAYGQPTISEEKQGTIKIAINVTTQSVQDNINYKGAQYIGLTSAEITDKMVIQYGEQKLKVLYVNPNGRLTQAFMVAI